MNTTALLQNLGGIGLYFIADFIISRVEPLRVRPGATLRSRRLAMRARLLVASMVSVFLAIVSPGLVVSGMLLGIAAVLLAAVLFVRVPGVHERKVI
jgi:hypothetical protein